jgi:hypothetical protein
MDESISGSRSAGQGVRPNIDISHQLNGRVKDYASRNGLSTAEAYSQIIKRGLIELEDEE